MLIEEAKAIGASILFFPEGKNVQAGGVCSAAAIPDPADPGWVDLMNVESWEGDRKDSKYQAVKDSSKGKLELTDEVETDGYPEYKFTTNIVVAFVLGLFFRSAVPLDKTTFQFDPEKGISPRGWIIIDSRDQNGVMVFAANLWGRMKYDGPLKGGGGDLVKPELIFTQYRNGLNTMSLGTEA
ncbi:MAG TPA: hypothetical protein VGO57_02170 [Verrucomicrobiae bacterium]